MAKLDLKFQRTLMVLMPLLIVYLALWVLTFTDASNDLRKQIVQEAHGQQTDTGSITRRQLYRELGFHMMGADVEVIRCHMPFLFEAKVTVDSGRGIYGTYVWTPWYVYTVDERTWIS